MKNLTRTALVVDDEKDLLKIIKRRLEKIGIRTDIAENGEHGLEKLRQNTYNYLLVDLKMPDIDGETLIKLAKDHRLLDNTVVIVITGGFINEYPNLKQNIDGFLQKPFSLEDLTALLSKPLLTYS